MNIFPNLHPQNWGLSNLGSIIIFLTDFQANGGFASLKENVKYFQEENYAVLVRLKDLRKNMSAEDGFVYTDKHGYDYLKKSSVKEGDILVANVGSVGVTLQMPRFDRLATLAPNMFKVLISDNITKKYFLYFCQSPFFWQQIKTTASGGTSQPKINKKQYSNILIPISPLAEQKRIVSKIEELFSDLDKGMESLKTAQQQLKVYRQAVLTWTLDADYTENKNCILKDISEKIQIGPFGTQLHKEDYIENGIPLINPMHIKNGGIFADSSFSISEAKQKSLTNYILRNNDIIMGRRGEMGRCGIVSEKEDGWICGTGSLYIRPKMEMVIPKFLWYFLRSEITIKYLNENAAGTTMTNLNLSIVNNIPLSLPPIKKQLVIINEIESRLSVCDKIEESIENSLKQAEALRQSILKKAFEGRLVPQDPNDEPASELLKRIQSEKTAAVQQKKTTKSKKTTGK